MTLPVSEWEELRDTVIAPAQRAAYGSPEPDPRPDWLSDAWRPKTRTADT